MKTIKRLVSLTAVLALVLSMAACTSTKAKSYNTITVGNIQLKVRDDMKEDTSIKSKGDTYLTCYYWDGYGMNVGRIEAEDYTKVKFAGKTIDEALKAAAEDEKNVTDIMKYGNISYLEYTETDDDKDYLFTDYMFEVGNELYYLEFYTLSKSSAKYREEYEYLVDSVQIVEEPAKTVDVTINGIVVTLDGDAYKENSTTYVCSRYMIACDSTYVGTSYSAEEIAKLLVQRGNYKTADGNDVTEEDITVLSDGTSVFKCATSLDGYTLHAYNYVKVENGKFIYIMLGSLNDDAALVKDYETIVSGAHLE